MNKFFKCEEELIEEFVNSYAFKKAHLSKKEKIVVKYFLDHPEYSRLEYAKAMNLKESTLSFHIGNIFKKMKKSYGIKFTSKFSFLFFVRPMFDDYARENSTKNLLTGGVRLAKSSA